MNSVIQNIFRRTTKTTELTTGDVIDSSYRAGKSVYRFKVLVRTGVKDAVLIIIGILSAGFGLKGFLLPNKFIDGGATGISLLITELSGVPLSLIIILVNMPFIALAYKQMGRVLQ